MKMTWSRSIKLLIAIVFLILLVYCWLFYQERAENDRQRQIFTSTFHENVFATLLEVDRTLESGENNLSSNLAELEKRLIKVDLTLYLGRFIMDDSVYYTPYFEMLNKIIYGIQATGPTAKISIPPFNEDNRLDETEIRYLQLLKDELTMISQAMLNEGTKQVRADISIEEFNEILKPIIYDPDVISFHRKVQKGDSHPTPALPE